MQKQQFLTPKDILGYAEEYIVLEKDKELIKFSLANNLDDIKIAIYARTGLSVDLDNAYWELNPNISTKVKHLMNKHRVAYSMTTDQKDDYEWLYINMRVGDKWFSTNYFRGLGRLDDGSTLNFQKVAMYGRIMDMLGQNNSNIAVPRAADILPLLR